MKTLLDTIRSRVRDDTKPPATVDEWLRASGFAYTCFRHEALSHYLKRDRVDIVDASRSSNFLLGTVMHTGMQCVLLRKHLLGAWKCLSCLHMHGGYPEEERAAVYRAKECSYTSVDAETRALAQRAVANITSYAVPCPDACEACGAEATGEIGDFEYVEQWMCNFDLGIGGHTDGFLRVDWREDLGVFEGKSIAPQKVYLIRNAPYVEHLYQVHLYMYFSGLQWASILYWDKGTYGVPAFTEHYITRDEGIIEDIHAAIHTYRDYFSSGVLPARVCSSPTCDKAKYCKLRQDCFSQLDG